MEYREIRLKFQVVHYGVTLDSQFFRLAAFSAKCSNKIYFTFEIDSGVSYDQDSYNVTVSVLDVNRKLIRFKSCFKSN